jgi:UDP-glucose 4-epimerase
MLNKILITGACCFIGLNLTKFLFKKKFKNLLLLDNFSTSEKKHYLNRKNLK